VAVWPVVVSQWQHACCGEPFAVGDEISWKLAVLEADRTVGLREELAVIAGHVVGVDHTEQGDPAAIVEIDAGVVVGWDGDRPVGDRIDVRGVLAQEHHGGVPDDLPATRGVVRRIRVVSWSYDARGEPKDIPAELRDVARSPSTWDRNEDGMLVDLDIRT
jgi:hypothetical protein